MSNREPTKDDALEMVNRASFEVLKASFRLAKIPFDEEMLELDFRLMRESILQIDQEEITQKDVEREVRDFLKTAKVPPQLSASLLQTITAGIWIGLRPSGASFSEFENLLDKLRKQ